MELSGKVALVTGSSRGIGREISRALAQTGARIAVHYRSDQEARSRSSPPYATTVLRTRSSVRTWPGLKALWGGDAAPEEVAGTVAFLASDAPDFMTGAIVDVRTASPT